MRNKRGSMILSFVIFITFVLFIYSIIKPSITMGEDKRTTLEYIEKKITENISSNMTTASISIISASNPDENCVKLNDFIFYSKTGDREFVKNSLQNIQTAYTYTQGTINYLALDRTSKTDTFFKVYFSPEFDRLSSPPSGITCDPLNYNDDYSIGSINSGRYIFIREVSKLKNYYDSNYEQLRSDFKIPPGNEFGFDFIQSNGSKISAIQKLIQGNIFADEFPIQYIDEQANILSGFINIKVW